MTSEAPELWEPSSEMRGSKGENHSPRGFATQAKFHKRAVASWKDEASQERVAGALSVGPFLFSHAGYRPKLLRRVNSTDPAELVQHVNDRLKDRIFECRDATKCAFPDDLFSVGPDRGGKGLGGVFWTDWRVLQAAPEAHLPSTFVQIVGHSAAQCDAKRTKVPPPVS